MKLFKKILHVGVQIVLILNTLFWFAMIIETEKKGHNFFLLCFSMAGIALPLVLYFYTKRFLADRKKILPLIVQIVLLLNTIVWLSGAIHHLRSTVVPPLPLGIAVALMLIPWMFYYFISKRFTDLRQPKQNFPSAQALRPPIAEDSSNIEPGSIPIYPNKDLLWGRLVLATGLIGFAIFMILYVGPVGTVLGLFAALGGVGGFLLILKPLLNPQPTLILTDEYIDIIIKQELPEHLNILYSDISFVDKADSLFGNKLPNDVALRINDIEKYSNKSMGNALLASVSANNIILHLEYQDVEAETLVQLLSRKIQQPNIPILELWSGGEYKANTIPLTKRLLNIAISVFLVGYVSYGLVVDKILIPSKRGDSMELHGVSAWVMAIAAFFCVANLIAVVLDHYDQRNNEKTYKQYRSLLYRGSVALFFVSLVLSLFLHVRDYKCKNIIVDEVEILDKGKKVIVYNRYCAEIEPMKDDTPGTFIALRESGEKTTAEDLEVKDPANSIVNMSGCVVHDITWSQDRLKVQYSPNKQWPKRKRGAYVNKKSPLPVDLVKVQPRI
jgi:hypothetical protein